MTNDLTTGKPLKLILQFSMPLLIGMLFQQFYSMADTVIVGNTLGVQALAAVGSTGSLNFLVLGFAQGLTSGFAVYTAQRFGAYDDSGVRRSVAASILLCVISTLVITALAVAGTRPLLELMDTPPDIIDEAYRYIVVIFLGIAASVFYNMISSILRALGDAKTPLLFLIIASLLNIGLDFLFILAFHTGVEGAAWATVLSQLVSGFLCLIYTAKRFPMLHLHREDFRFRWGFVWAHLKIGLPMAFQFSITAVGTMILQSALNQFGSTAVASYTASSRIENIVTQPLNAFGVTMATYSAQNYGAGQMHRIRQGVSACTLLSVSFAVGGALLSLLLGGWLTQLFVSGSEPELISEVIEKSQTYLNIMACFIIILGQLFIYRNVLQGIGKGFVPLMAGVAELLMRGFVAFVVASAFGYLGVCFANPAAWIGATVPLAIKYFLEIRKLDPRPKRIGKKAREKDPGALAD